MTRRTKVVVEARERSDDDLLLPRPPGVLRRFWARHPRAVDVLVAVFSLLFSLPATSIRSTAPTPPTMAEVWFAVALAVIAAAALLWRRRFPLVVFAVVCAPLVLLPASLAPVMHLLLAVALYAVAVYRSVRACWVSFAAALAVVAASTIVAESLTSWTSGYATSNAVSAVIGLLLGALIGVSVGGRRRYTEALIDRSRQLLTERDQQAQLAAAAERTRIAREMHDIVSHSLTVIVALSEGAAAASSPERARQASRGAADTAREALGEMRAMLGVLREDGDERSPLEPLEPVEPAQIAETAQRAGYPVRLETIGSLAGLARSARFAIGRVVQEGVTNAMRHAPAATEVTVRVAVSAAEASVEVRNDAAVPAGGSGGFGLRGLRERVEHVGGSLESGYRGDGIWILRVSLPLTPAHPEGPS